MTTSFVLCKEKKRITTFQKNNRLSPVNNIDTHNL